MAGKGDSGVCAEPCVREVPAHQGEGHSLEGDGFLFTKFPLEI